MNAYKRGISLGVYLLLGIIVFGQFDSTELQQQEIELKTTYDKIFTSSKPEKSKIEKEFEELFFQTLQLDNSQNYEFKKLSKVGRIHSENNELIIFSWNIPNDFGFSNYYCIIQVYSKNEKKIYTWRLIENKSLNSRSGQMLSTPSNWYGCLYYEIIETKFKGQQYFTLFGSDFSNVLSNKKLIETIKINEKNEIEFVPSMFNYNNRPENRIVFEFAEQARMTLHFDPEREIIIFDHLAPERPSLEKQYQFYGPDGSYDGFEFVEGKWQHLSDIKIGN